MKLYIIKYISKAGQALMTTLSCTSMSECTERFATEHPLDRVVTIKRVTL